MKKILAAMTAALMMVALVSSAAIAAPAVKFSTSLTEDGVAVTGAGTAASPYIVTTTGVAGATHTLGTTGSVAHPALLPGNYPFFLKATASQQTVPVRYFANKNWGVPAYYAQINAEIAGTAPFFYAVIPGNATLTDPFLADGFAAGLGMPGMHFLAIDDDYPVGTYSYTGMFKDGKPFQFTFVMKVVRAPLAPPTIVAVCPSTIDPNQGGVDYYWTIKIAGVAPDYNIDTSTDGVNWSGPLDWSDQNDPIAGGGWSGPMVTTSYADGGGSQLWVRRSSVPSSVTGPVTNTCNVV